MSGIALAATVKLAVVLIQSAQIRRQLKLSNISDSRQHYFELNKVALHDEQALTKLEATYDQILATLVIGAFETQFEMHENGLLKDKMWESDVRTMKDEFRHEFMIVEWPKLESQYYQPFADFINRQILPDARAKYKSRQAIVD